MSLNWQEIDTILNELQLAGTFIQNIIQPDFSSLVFDVYRPGGSATAVKSAYSRFSLLISFSSGAVRLHALSHKPDRKIKLQRFPQLLRSRIKGCRILRAFQIPGQRIVGMELNMGGESGNNSILWLRLWGNAANALFCDHSSGKIIDAFYRRPKKGEISGGMYNPEDCQYNLPDHDFSPRPVEAGCDFNTTIELQYSLKSESEEFNKKIIELTSLWTRYTNSQEGRLNKLTRESSLVTSETGSQHTGDLLLANIHRILPGTAWVEVEDYLSGETKQIQLDPALTPNENVQAYYQRHKKEERRKEHSRSELEDQTTVVNHCHMVLEKLQTAETLHDIELIPSPPSDKQRGNKTGVSNKPKGLFLSSGKWQIIVGRTALESDTILRSWAKGNDFWVHTRDFPGGHIFLRGPKGDTPPLNVLLDAGNLAVYYSKARPGGKADCYYTQVKYLRRPKDGKTGTVLATQEKNLAIQIDDFRLSQILERGIHAE